MQNATFFTNFQCFSLSQNSFLKFQQLLSVKKKLIPNGTSCHCRIHFPKVLYNNRELILEVLNAIKYIFLIGFYSMQGWTATTRHEFTRKKEEKDKKDIGI